MQAVIIFDNRGVGNTKLVPDHFRFSNLQIIPLVCLLPIERPVAVVISSSFVIIIPFPLPYMFLVVFCTNPIPAVITIRLKSNLYYWILVNVIVVVINKPMNKLVTFSAHLSFVCVFTRISTITFDRASPAFFQWYYSKVRGYNLFFCLMMLLHSFYFFLSR